MATELNFVHQAEEEERLDNLLLAAAQQEEPLRATTRSQVKRWIESGLVTVNGKSVSKAGARVKFGHEVAAQIPNPEPQELQLYPIDLDVLHEDESLIVINKPSGLAMHPGAGNPARTLLNALAAHVADITERFENCDRLGIVHRLDKDTTGVVVAAKTPAAHAALSSQFEQRSIGRRYDCMVLTTPRARRAVQLEEQGRIETRIGRHPSRRTQMAVVEEGGRLAVTNWRRIEQLPYSCCLEIRLETGRTHQIRVHLEHLGSPVLGDPLYGDCSPLPVDLQRECSTFGRQALHARRLEFDHPVTGKRLQFEAPPPADYLALLEVFRAWRP